MQDRGECIRAFLLAPLSQHRFRAFFDLCHATTIGLLNYYRSRGYPVPIDRADTQTALSDQAYTLLGEFFAPAVDEPFPAIFGYFARHDIDDFQTAPPEELYDHFRILLSGFVKKQLFRQRRAENPQAEILKRRIKDILQPPEYLRFQHNPSRNVMVARSDQADHLREQASSLPYSRLEDIVQQTYHDAHTRSSWCRSIFEYLDREHDYRNFLALQDLLLTMVGVNASELEELVPGPAEPVSPDLDAAYRLLGATVRDTVAWAERAVVAPFMERGRLTAADSRAYLRAVELYLLDLGYSGDTDPIPRYFREVMPPECHPQYLNTYKYTFEAVLSCSMKHFRESLAKVVT